MKTKKLLCIFFLLQMGILPICSQQINEKLATELQEKSTQTQTIKCTFQQTRVSKVLTDKVTKKGTFFYQKPESIRLSFNDGDYILMTQEWFEMKNAENVNKTKVTSNPMLRNLSNILSACMIGDLSKLTRDFTIDATETPVGWEVKMKPKRGRAAAKIAQIFLAFEKNNMSLSKMKMEEKSGDYTEYIFTDKIFNIELENGLFCVAK